MFILRLPATPLPPDAKLMPMMKLDAARTAQYTAKQETSEAVREDVRNTLSKSFGR